MRVLGVDGCKLGWIAVELADGAFAAASLHTSFTTIAAHATERGIDVVAVDMPLGLADASARDADGAVRDFLRARRATLFPVPPRAVVQQRTWSAACATAAAMRAPGCSKQVFNLFAKIRELDVFVADARIHEVHPETSFALLAGRVLATKKSTWAGASERRALLAAVGITVPDDIGAAGESGVDDVLDAAVCAWTATRIARGEARSFPEQTSQRDRSGRPLCIRA